MSELSEELAALLVMGDVLAEGAKLSDFKSYTVLQYDYKCGRRRSVAGNPFGPEMSSYLNFTIKAASDGTGKEFLERMQQAETFPYSFLFNVGNANKAVVVAFGYIVDVEEIFNSAPDGSEDEQMLIKCRVLLSNIVFAGNEKKKLKLTITND